MSITAAIRKMMEAGFTVEQALAAAEIFEETATPVRTARQERNARYYAKKRLKASEQDVSDVSDTVSLEQKDPTPQKTQTLPKENPPKGGQKKGTRLPDDWQPPVSLIAYAAEHGITGAWLSRETERFRNFWHAKSGRDATKADWNATWRNWILKAAENGPPKDIQANSLEIRDKPTTGQSAGDLVWLHRESPQFEAWVEQTHHPPSKIDRNGGWWFPSEFPPTAQMQAAE